MDDALKQLHDLHLPEAPAGWPPAPGWWLLAFLLFAAAALAVVYVYRARRRTRPLRRAERALDGLLASAHDGRIATLAFVDAVNALLKRALIHGAHQPSVAPLSGAAWLTHLDAVGGGDAFVAGPGAILGDDRFSGADLRGDLDGLHAAARNVLRAIARNPRR